MEDDAPKSTDSQLQQQGAAPPPLSLTYASHDLPRPGKSSTLVTAATFSDAWEAHLAAGKLEAEGIPATIADENIVSASGGLYAVLAGGVKVQVLAVDLERALAVLPARVRVRLTQCPKCRSTDTRQIDFTPGVKALFLCMLGLPYLFVEKPWLCLDCGYAWRKQPEDETAREQQDEEEDD